MSKITEILISLPLSESRVESLRKLSKNILIHYFPSGNPQDIPSEIWEKIEVLYTNTVFPEENQAVNLRWIQTSKEKTDSQIVSELENRKNVQITNMEGINSIQVAEHALALLLSLSRKTAQLFNLQENNEWINDPQKIYHPFDLYESTVGIVGYDGIGRQIGRLLKGFGCRVLASTDDAMNPSKEGFTLEGTGDPEGAFFTRLYPHQAIISMFKECDSVIVTTALSNSTRNLLGEKQLEALNSKAMLVDVSEGGVINLEALTDLMADNKISGAALDVFPEFPLPADNLLWSLPNVIISPNVSRQSKNHFQRSHDLFVNNILRYLDGQKLYNLQDLKID